MNPQFGANPIGPKLIDPISTRIWGTIRVHQDKYFVSDHLAKIGCQICVPQKSNGLDGTQRGDDPFDIFKRMDFVRRIALQGRFGERKTPKKNPHNFF